MDYREAVACQKNLAAQVRVCPDPSLDALSIIAAADVSYHKKSRRGYAALVVAAWPDQRVLEIATCALEVDFPYIPGLLSFRELPLVREAWRRLTLRPDLLICDGHGLAHPRRFGLACHAGVELGVPAIGCAKSRLVGGHAEPGPRKGDRTPLIHREQRIGTVLRTRDGVQPLYVSIGHRVTLEQSESIVLALCTRYRLPEIARRAHGEVTRLRQRDAASG